MVALSSPARILLIDDDELSRSVLELQLGGAGYEVISTVSGDDAIVQLSSPKPPTIDIVLTDLQMPGLSGPKLALQLRVLLLPAVQLIVMSGSQPAPDRIAGFDRFLLKPFTPDQLASALTANSPEESLPQSSALVGHAEPVLKEASFTQLAAMLQPAQLQELFALAFSELAKHLARMHQAASRDDLDAFRTSAHAIKGSFGMVGACELQALAASLEAGESSPADQAASLRKFPLAAARLQRMLTMRGVYLSRDTSSPQETQ